MDFFEAQERAKRRTGRLVVLFILAVLGTILCTYLAMVMIRQFAFAPRGHHRAVQADVQLWDPSLLGLTTAGVLVVAGAASLFKWGQMREGGAAIAEMVGGRRVAPTTTDADERRLLNIVEEMAIASGLPVPPVYVLHEEAGINAFAAGLTHGDAVVAVTDGTLRTLNRDELQGVVAHEFSHILQGDMRLNVRLTAVLFGILVLGLLGRGMLEVGARTRIGGGKGRGNATLVFILVGLALLVVGYIGYFFGRLIQAAVSRQREFLADAAAVQFTRNPQGIGDALRKIGGHSRHSELENPEAAQFGHFYFAQGSASLFGGGFATHPPLEERIRAIDPSWDGSYLEPEPRSLATEEETGTPPRLTAALAGFAGEPTPPPARPLPQTLVERAGQLTLAQFGEAQRRLQGMDPRLRELCRHPDGARAVLSCLLEASTAGLPTTSGTGAWAPLVAQVGPVIASLGRELKLPLAQLATQGLRELAPAEQTAFLDTVSRLIAADGRTTPFEFSVLIMVRHTLEEVRQPSRPVEFYSFQALSEELSAVLSLLAWIGADNEAKALEAFQTGRAQLKLVQEKLRLLPLAECGNEVFNQALGRLHAASLPIKKRCLVAAAAVIGADGETRPEEMELMRAVSVAIGCPMPVWETSQAA
jgi:Zn-dependent protease with chaperone function